MIFDCILHPPKRLIPQKPCHFWPDDGGIEQAGGAGGEEAVAMVDGVGGAGGFFLFLPSGQEGVGGGVGGLEETEVDAEFDNGEGAVPVEVEVVVEVLEILGGVVYGVFKGEVGTPGFSVS